MCHYISFHDDFYFTLSYFLDFRFKNVFFPISFIRVKIVLFFAKKKSCYLSIILLPEYRNHRSFKHFHHLNPFAKKSTWAIFLPIPLAFGNGISLNLKTRDGRESSQSSHRKSPKSPYGGISPNIVYETCRASNSVWKIGITSFIRMMNE